MIATATNITTQPTSEIRKLNFMTDIGSTRCRESRALRVCCDDAGKEAACCGRGPVFGAGRRIWAPLGFGWLFGLGLVRPEKDEPTLDARSRAPLAAPESADWALTPPLADGGRGDMSDGEVGVADGR